MRDWMEELVLEEFLSQRNVIKHLTDNIMDHYQITVEQIPDRIRIEDYGGVILIKVDGETAAMINTITNTFGRMSVKRFYS